MRHHQSQLVARRESAMDMADHALDKAWPERQGEDYVRDMRAAAAELESIASEMRAGSMDTVETSRAYRYLGSVYSDLAPALGSQMLGKAIEAYSEAETLLAGYGDALEQAKLDFNFGNALRQFDPNDVAKLQDAERRFLKSRAVFAELAPQHLVSVDEALKSTRGLLKIAPVAQAVERGRSDMAALERQLTEGGDVAEIAAKMQEVRERGGGAPALFAEVQGLISGVPESAKRDPKYSKLIEQMAELTSLLQSGAGPTDSQEREVMRLLRQKLEEEANQGRVTRDRAETLASLLDDFGKALGGEEDLPSMMKRLADLRSKAAAQFENLHYLSHGIDRPPDGSRAAALVELCWDLRLFLLDEINQRGKSEGEGKRALDLNVRAATVDKRIYKAGGDDARAMLVDQEALRPFALEVRDFASRHHPLLVRPIWAGSPVQTSTKSVLYAGPREHRDSIGKICKKAGFRLMSGPSGKGVASSRWEQLQKAYVTIFDLRAAAGPERASVAYELGIARTLGKPVVVLAQQDQRIPFDVDVQPVLLSGTVQDANTLSEAIDRAAVWMMPRPRVAGVTRTVEEVLSRYPIPQGDPYIDQTLKQLQQQEEEPDPVAVTTALKSLVSFLGKDAPMLIHPVWPPTYPGQGRPRLFHVMPFQPAAWADAVAEGAEAVCVAAGAQYVRGDRVREPNVIRSIWDEINQSTHILVDLTGFNENVALELGIAHALGRPTLMVGQGDTVKRLFPMIAKFRFHPYEDPESGQMNASVEKFLSEGGA